MSDKKDNLTTRVKEHLDSKSHKINDKKRIEEGRVQLPLEKVLDLCAESKKKQEEFLLDLANAFVAANIPLYRLEVPTLAGFLNKYTRFRLPSANTLRYNYVNKLFERTLERIREVVGENDIFMSIDETMDRCDRAQVNFIVGVLNGEPFEPMLVYVAYPDKCDADALLELYIEACRALWPVGKVHYERVKLLVTDQASYMLRAGNLFKSLSPKIMHVTCIAHCFSRVAENVRESHPKLDEFLARFKEVLRTGARKSKYKEHTKLKLPPKPVITRWTTWLQAAEYAGQHLEKISSFINSLTGHSRALSICQELVDTDELVEELVSVSDYYFLIEATTKIQGKSMRLEEAWALIKDVGERLDRPALAGPRRKFESSLEKNPHIEAILSSDDVNFRIQMKYAPVVSADVERSFSKTKRVLTPERCSFDTSNLHQHYIISFNAFLFN